MPQADLVMNSELALKPFAAEIDGDGCNCDCNCGNTGNNGNNGNGNGNEGNTGNGGSNDGNSGNTNYPYPYPPPPQSPPPINNQPPPRPYPYPPQGHWCPPPPPAYPYPPVNNGNNSNNGTCGSNNEAGNNNNNCGCGTGIAVGSIEAQIAKLSKKSATIRKMIDNLINKNKSVVISIGAGASYNFGTYCDKEGNVTEYGKAILEMLQAELDAIKAKIVELTSELEVEDDGFGGIEETVTSS